MKPFFSHPWVLIGLRLILAGLFLYAGWLKLRDPQAFADSIAAYQLLPDFLINLTALTLPVLELVAGLLLLIGKEQRVALLAVLAMGCVFAVALVWAITKGLEVDCGCFGSGKPTRWSAWIALGRDLLILTTAGWLYFLQVISGLVTPSTSRTF